MIQFRNIMNTSLVLARRMALLLIALFISHAVWAGDFIKFGSDKSDKYAEVSVKVSPEAKGKVYADTEPETQSSFTYPDVNTYSLKSSGTKQYIKLFGIQIWSQDYNDITFNLYAADRTGEGYVWAGWYEESNTDPTTMDNPAKVTITAAGTEKKPTTKTYIAKWLQPQVTDVNPLSIDFGTITNPTLAVEAQDVKYTVADYMGEENFVMSTTPSSFTHSKADEPIITDTYTSSISYTPTGIHGAYTGAATLASSLHMAGTTYENSQQEVSLAIVEDYTPKFTAAYNTSSDRYDFQTVAIGSNKESTADLYTTDNNYAASVLSTTSTPKYGRADWYYDFDEFSITGKNANDYFSVKSATGDAGKPIVVFDSKSDGTIYGFTSGAEGECEVTARMSIQCTYYDANNKPQYSDIKYSYLKVTVRQENTSSIQFNENVSGDFGEVVMGERPSKDIGIYYAFMSFEDKACQLTGDAAKLFTVSAKPENGKVTVQISEDWDDFLGCDEHTATLTITGTRTALGKNNEPIGEKVTLTLPISATLILGNAPEVVAAGGNKLVTFTWQKITGAKYYDLYYKTGNDDTYSKLPPITPENNQTFPNLTSNGTHYTYTFEFQDNGNANTTYCYVVAKTNNDNLYTVTDTHTISPETKCITISAIVSATPNLEWILQTNASNTGYKTGVVVGQSADGDAPNAKHRDVVLSAAFDASGNPIADRLYIFGETNEENTPLHIYEKKIEGDKKGYKYLSEINAQKAHAATIDAAGISSLYFTGYCANAYTGNGEEGVIHIKGGSKTLNIYINDLQLYAKDYAPGTTHTINASSMSAINADGNNYYAKGKGSVFVFESSSLNDASPFAIKMHIRGFNTLDAAKGAAHTINIVQDINGNKEILTDTPDHYSSPIAVLPVATGGINQRTSLLLDDVWPSEPHTNGQLLLLEKNQNANKQGISIDMGNAGTTLIIEGGQYSFMPIAAAYRTTNYNVEYKNSTMLTINAYGISKNNPDNHDEVGGITAVESINASKSIALNDGTFSSSAAIKWYAQSLTVDGGSYNQVIEHYTANASKATDIRNKDGKKLYRATVEYNDTYGTGRNNEKAGITNFAKMVEDLFPDAGINIKATNNENREYHYPLSAYYVGGKSYGYKSLTLDNNKLYLMVPWLDCKSLYLPWRFCSPTLIADVDGTKMPLGGSLERVAGCPDHADSHYTVDRLLYMQIDSYTQNSLDNYYLYGANVSIDLDGEKLYGTINDVADYTIQDKVYMLMPIEAARWTLFTPPFDVANVYVIESYPENQLVKDHGGKRGKIPTDRIVEARAAQAQRLMDLYVYWYQEEIGVGEPSDFFDANSTTDITGDEVPEPYGKFVLDWMAYEKQNHKGNTTGDYTPIIEKLIHFTGKKGSYPEGKTWLNANYYLYKANEWALNEDGNFRTDWDTVTVAHDGANPIMSKGQVYALQFPYNSINGVHDPSTTWDYWTGKYLLIESTIGSPLRPHTINGSDADIMPTTNLIDNSAVLIGNASFAEVTKTPPAGTQLFAIEKIKVGEDGNDTGRDIHELDAKDNATLYPAEGALLAKIQAPKGMRARTINYQTGEVIYEEFEEEDMNDQDNQDNQDVTTDIPTIAGDKSLIVIPTESGLTILPRQPQQVTIYDVEGKLLFNQYVMEEQSVILPSSIYIVRGEKERIKVIKY